MADPHTQPQPQPQPSGWVIASLLFLIFSFVAVILAAAFSSGIIGFCAVIFGLSAITFAVLSLRE